MREFLILFCSPTVRAISAQSRMQHVFRRSRRSNDRLAFRIEDARNRTLPAILKANTRFPTPTWPPFRQDRRAELSGYLETTLDSGISHA
ncbi:hypothetical protein [Dyella mobilis]|uniref:Uncharacterized protein n=1 Tax=Dyella mobilis TaxID=1849582 RepID=A0ABS2KEP8_9GAMM|nr:hypothetical protein [Dyella mobilis]MBM7129388.1 hypothetical protein [Dyella mobilis]